jgi:hypothetical protein
VRDGCEELESVAVKISLPGDALGALGRMSEAGEVGKKKKKFPKGSAVTSANDAP